MPFLEINGAKQYYEVSGEGFPLLLIHGFFFDHRAWNFQLAAFAEKYQVIRCDVRGFGKSELGTEPYSVIEDLATLLDHLQIQRAYVLGLSMGGFYAIEFTLQYPERVEALLLAGAGVNGYAEPDELVDRADEIDRVGAGGDIEKAREMFIELWVDGQGKASETLKSVCRAGMSQYKFSHFQNGAPKPEPIDHKATDRLSEIGVPTLVMVGDRDQQTMIEIADVLEQNIHDCKKVTFQDVAHEINLEIPEEFNQTVLEFLNNLNR